MSNDIKIFGTVSPGFESILDIYASNFHRGDIYEELGSSFCAYHDGQCVVDIWAGYTSRDKSQLWSADTTINVYSTTKALAAVCVGILADRGLLNYTDLVSKHWPEFAQNGKESTTVSHLMSHQSGNPGLRETTEMEDLLDWDLICSRIARQEPYWKPGEDTAYHAWTYGYLAGELVRRVSGKTIGTFLREEVAGPLGADAYIGLPEEKDANAAVLYGPKRTAPTPDLDALPEVVVATMTNPALEAETPNQRHWRAAEMPGIGGYASGRGLAKIFAPLAHGGTLDGFELMSASGVDAMTEIQSSRVDFILGKEVNWANGLVINNLDLYGPNEKTFGHSGWGGSYACADRENKVAIGYVCNQMGPEPIGDPRSTMLANAIYDCIGS